MEGLDTAEKRRIVDLLKTGKDGAQSGSSMDWMYGEKKVDTDDYLLGKKIDKHFEKGDQTPPKEDDIFGERIKANIALDMQAKMREDPLYAIKKREEESRRKILQNPVKMKELQKLIAQQKKERKKKKKKHKHKHGSRDDDDDDDDDLVQQYLSILTQKHGQEHHHDRKAHQKGGDHRSSSSEPDQHRHRSKGQHQNEGNKGRHISKKNRKEHEQQKPGSSPESDQPSFSRPVHKPGGRRKASGSPESGQKRYGLIKSSKHQSRSRSRSPLKYPGEKSPPRRPSLQSGRSSHSSRSQQYRPRSRSPLRRDHQRMRRSPAPPKRKVSNEEREQRLKEMLDNAKWREDQRKNNVQRYREEDQREEAQRKKKGSSADFLNPLMSQHATNSTVEDRLRRNKYNIQRTKAALEKDFTKH